MVSPPVCYGLENGDISIHTTRVVKSRVFIRWLSVGTYDPDPQGKLIDLVACLFCVKVLCSPAWPGTSNNLLVFVSWVLELWACATMTS